MPGDGAESGRTGQRYLTLVGTLHDVVLGSGEAGLELVTGALGDHLGQGHRGDQQKQEGGQHLKGGQSNTMAGTLLYRLF